MKRILIFGSICWLWGLAYGQVLPTVASSVHSENLGLDSTKKEKMKIEIWSDVVCPFCYIGKREFEKALGQFADTNFVQIEWKSFQLMPDMPTNYDKSSYQYFADKYGTSMKEAKEAHESVTNRASTLGLNYQFDIAKPANTLKAHQLIHFAKLHGKQDEAEEILFRSYFTEGKNLNDIATLLEIAQTIGLDTAELKPLLENDALKEAVQKDIVEAQNIGVRGVPFFVFDRKYAVSGAQASDAFLQTLEKAFEEWKSAHPESVLQVQEGANCNPETKCE